MFRHLIVIIQVELSELEISSLLQRQNIVETICRYASFIFCFYEYEGYCSLSRTFTRPRSMSGTWVKGQSYIWNSDFIHCKYHTGWTALAMIVTIGGTYAPFWMRMASLFFKVNAQGHTINIVVVVRKDTWWSVQLGLPISIHILILNERGSLYFVKERGYISRHLSKDCYLNIIFILCKYHTGCFCHWFCAFGNMKAFALF